jgi:polysaccharide export outer membrane protein
MSSCIPQSKILYLQDKGEQVQTEFDVKKHEYKIKPGDDLYIKVLSFDQESAQVFNQMTGSGGNMNMNIQMGAGYMISFMVSDSGNIVFPLIGKLDVQGKSLDEITNLLNSQLAKYINYTTVVVKLMNFRVTILGEVNMPGQLDVLNERINIFEAIGRCGDLAEYGNRREIQLLRERNGETKLHLIDITDKKIIESEYYWLQPDDVLYIPPMAAKPFGLRNFQLQTILSIVSTTLVLIVTIQNLQN